MAFDRNDSADLLALKNEINLDPIGMGYVSVIDSTNLLLKLINNSANNVGGETVAKRLTPELLLDVLVVDDFAGNQVTDGERRFLEVFLNKERTEDIEKYREKIRQTFKTNSATVVALDALVRPLSRAEVLFGENTVIFREDWVAARDS
jgi:hypothetical protein